MAIFKSTLFHRLKNSLGNTVVYTYCGKGVMRSKPEYVRNPKTPAQQQVRLRFKAVAKLSAYFRKAALLGFPAPYAVQSHNAFVGANMSIFDIDENMQVRPDFRRLVCSQGRLQKPSVTLEASGNHFLAHVAAQKISAYCSRTDTIHAALWEYEYGAVHLVEIGKRDGDYTLEFSYPDKFNPAYLFIYIFAVSANRKQASDSLLCFAP